MTPKENGNASAMPCLDASSEGLLSCREFGLSKRELFAAMAFQGLLANPAPGLAQGGCNSLAVMAVHAADALLDELARATP